MGDGFEDAIVAYVDLIGTIKKIEKSEATLLMRQMHETVRNALAEDRSLPAISHAYAWNDSVLLVLEAQDTATYGRALHAVAGLRARLAAPSYAIIVKGQTFPPLAADSQSSARLTVLRSSSFAMANCIETEPLAKAKAKELIAKGKTPPCWYIDERIVREVAGLKERAIASFEAPMLPKREARIVWCFEANVFSSLNPG